ncbi:hypothetical protein L798_07164 [Zootermopsis nevadensis]|uniref:Uncharacterized protein n=1 Tax=Zootermopsis nevadensis TaxID=136037 RepID=A0A067RG16_ZOONE|nr:hypothetical protein L798_07164 [Zootermopsis nevadensis]
MLVPRRRTAWAEQRYGSKSAGLLCPNLIDVRVLWIGLIALRIRNFDLIWRIKELVDGSDIDEILKGDSKDPVKPWERPWTTDEMRQQSASWNLAGDSGLLRHLQQFSQVGNVPMKVFVLDALNSPPRDWGAKTRNYIRRRDSQLTIRAALIMMTTTTKHVPL